MTMQSKENMQQCAAPDERAARENPYSIGLPSENWRRGYSGERFLGYTNSPAEGFYKEGKAARKARATIAAQPAKVEGKKPITKEWCERMLKLEEESDSNIEAGSSADVASEASEILRDMLAIQEACGLHTDEYAPGSVIEYIKELESATPAPAMGEELPLKGERERFDDTKDPDGRYRKVRGNILERGQNGNYLNKGIQSEWEGWCLRAQPEPEPHEYPHISKEEYAELAALAVQREGRACMALRQPAGQEQWVLAKETVVEFPDSRLDLGYMLLGGVGVFNSFEEVSATIAEFKLPLGWVAMTLEQLLPGAMMSVHTPVDPVSQPAPAQPVAAQGEPVADQIIADANNYQFLKAHAFNTIRRGSDGPYVSWTLEIPAANEPGDNDSLDAAIAYEAKFSGWKQTYTAPPPAPVAAPDLTDLLHGLEVSIDVSTGEDDAGNRIFARVEEVMGGDKPTIIATEESRNFAAPAVAEGWRLVPDTSTGKMDDAGLAALPDGCMHIDAELCYAAMLAAAPKGQQ